MPSRRNRRNREILPPAREIGDYGNLITVTRRALYFSQTPEQLKTVFQDAIREVGFLGFSCYSSICKLLPDSGILSDQGTTLHHTSFSEHPKFEDFLNQFGNQNLYNDIAERLGDSSADYLYNIEEMSVRYFQDMDAVLDSGYQNPPRVTPFLTVQDSPKSQRPLLHAVLNLGRKFSQPVIEDQLNIPIEGINGQIIYLGLFIDSPLDLSTLYAGTVLTNAYHQHCQRMMHVETPRNSEQGISLGETQLA